MVTSPLAIKPVLYSCQFLTRYTPLGSLALRSSLRIFSGKKSRIYAVRCEVNILVNPSVARKRQSSWKRPDFYNNAPYMGNVGRAYLAPDGQLNLVPFGALVDDKGNYLTQSFEFTYLTSGRDLLRSPSSIPSRHGPV